MIVEAGQQVANYRLERQLGQGGMGSVWLASDPRLGRKVAIKFLAEAIATHPDVSARFMREARATAALRCEHTLTIYDVGITDAGTPYIVMEFIAGHSLAEELRRRGGGIEEGLAVDYVLQACIALAEAHARGFVHRDIKPSNLMLSLDGETAQIKLVDFGIAKAQNSTTDTFVTSSGAIIGTPAYMSPEQMKSSTAIDARTDIWSLGVVLYELIAGTTPYLAASPGEVFARVLRDRPAPLPAEIQVGLAEAVYQCLKPSPDDRFPNVAKLAETIAPYARDQDLALSAVARARRYLGLGPGAAFTLVGAPDFPRKKEDRHDPSVTVSPSGATAALTGPWEPLDAAIPEEMRSSRIPLLELFSQLFEAAVPVRGGSSFQNRGLVQLLGPAFETPGNIERDYYAVFMLDAQREEDPPGVIGQKTFAAHVRPLKSYIERIGSDRQKIVIVVSSSGELGAGVREAIENYRKELDALIVPIWLREIQQAYREARLPEIFERRLRDLYANHDPFQIVVERMDPMRCIGIGGLANQITMALASAGRILSVTALPGSGKSTLVRRVQYNVARREFVWVRCSELGQSVKAIADEILSGLRRVRKQTTSLQGIDESDFPRALGACLDQGAAFVPRTSLGTMLSAVAAPVPPVLVLEDTDWLVAQIVSGDQQARDLWSALGEWTRKRQMDTVITSVRGKDLEATAIGAWQNPARPHSIAITPLLKADLASLLRELGVGAAEFTEAAVGALYDVSQGNIGIALALCSSAYKERCRLDDPAALSTVELDQSDVARAASRLAARVEPIGAMFNSLLTDAERQALFALARGRVVSLDQLRKRLPEPEAADLAMRGLETMGLVDHDADAYRIGIPLIGMWIIRHVTVTSFVAQSQWRRRTKLVAIGAAFSAVMFATYLAFLRDRRPVTGLSGADDCKYLVNAPERADYGQTITVYIDRECPKKRAADVRVAPHGDNAAIVRPPPPPVCAQETECMFEQTIELAEQGEPTYEFRVLGGADIVGTFSIAHDSFAGLKATLAQIFSMVKLLPIALCMCLAFYKDLLRAVRSLWRRSDGDDAEPAKPTV